MRVIKPLKSKYGMRQAWDYRFLDWHCIEPASLVDEITPPPIYKTASDNFPG